MSAGMLHKSDNVIVGQANLEMLDIMWHCAAVCTDIEAYILLNSALVGYQESTISRSYLSEG